MLQLKGRWEMKKISHRFFEIWEKREKYGK